MKKRAKGLSLDKSAKYYDLMTPSEKSRFRRSQIEMIQLKPGERVLEVGCGTGVLSILAKLAVGDEGTVDGIDLAPRMIAQAQSKTKNMGLEINFQTASIDELPFPNDGFDVVISSLMFHHLPLEIKRLGLIEIKRVLESKGRFFLSDFCAPHPLTFIPMAAMLIWTAPTRYQLFGNLPGLLTEAGFKNVTLLKKGLFLEHYLLTMH